ncbi:unnamed protein product [Boreogadus saida]
MLLREIKLNTGEQTSCPRIKPKALLYGPVRTGLVSRLYFLSSCLRIGSEMVAAQCQRFEVRSADGGRVLFSADEQEISIGTEKLRVTEQNGRVCPRDVRNVRLIRLKRSNGL